MSRDKFMGRPPRGLEKEKKQKPQEFAFTDGTTRRANDATAAMVMRPATEEGKYQLKEENILGTFDDCPEIGIKSENARDWTGFKWERMKVVGYGYSRTVRRSNGKAKGRITYWIVRCACGRYEYRTNLILRKVEKGKRKGSPMCEVCDKVEQMRRSTK